MIQAYYLDLIREPVKNSAPKDALEDALISGQVYFKDGAFRGKFNVKISLILKKLGATFKNNSWRLENVPGNYLSAIAQGKMIDGQKVSKFLGNLKVIDIKREAIQRIIDESVQKISEDQDIRVKAQFTQDQLKQISEKYTENMEKHIKGWSEDEIKKLREYVNKTVRQGKRWETVAKEIQQRYDLAPKKAKFIARQETQLLATEMKEQKARKAGFNSYVWRTREDSRVRESHAHLDGEILTWDNPPVVDPKTGRRAHPGQDFNCRCTALILID